jgi:mRNA interferase YafQ
MKQFYEIRTYKQYDRDVKLAVHRGLDIEKLLTVVDMLRKGEPLPANLHNHQLTGDYKGYWECHIRSAQRDALLAKNPDWLLLYEKDIEIRIISLYRTGTHADIFGKGKKR